MLLPLSLWNDTYTQTVTVRNFPFSKPTACSGADSIEHGGTCPHFYKRLGTEAPGVEEQQTITWSTKLYWPSRKRSSERLVVLVEPKTWRDTTKYFYGALRRTCPSLSNSFRRHWQVMFVGRHLIESSPPIVNQLWYR